MYSTTQYTNTPLEFVILITCHSQRLCKSFQFAVTQIKHMKIFLNEIVLLGGYTPIDIKIKTNFLVMCEKEYSNWAKLKTEASPRHQTEQGTGIKLGEQRRLVHSFGDRSAWLNLRTKSGCYNHFWIWKYCRFWAGVWKK